MTHLITSMQGGIWGVNKVIYHGIMSVKAIYLAIAGNMTLSCNNTCLSNGHSFYYQVSAINSVGESPRVGKVSDHTPHHCSHSQGKEKRHRSYYYIKAQEYGRSFS